MLDQFLWGHSLQYCDMVMLQIKLNGITDAAIYGSKCFALRLLPTIPPPPPSDPGDGVKRSISTYTHHCHVAYQIKWNHECSNMVANILPADPHIPPPALWTGSIGQNSTFSEHVHVAYQIKWDHKCSNMVAKGVWSKVQIQLFQNMVILHIKFNGITNAATW